MLETIDELYRPNDRSRINLPVDDTWLTKLITPEPRIIVQGTTLFSIPRKDRNRAIQKTRQSNALDLIEGNLTSALQAQLPKRTRMAAILIVILVLATCATHLNALPTGKGPVQVPDLSRADRPQKAEKNF